MTRIEPGTLKCVMASRGTDDLFPALTERMRPDDIRRVSPTALLVHTALEPAELRDWLSGHLESGESLLVIEFEKWSGYGPEIDRTWLLERGH